MLVGLKDAFSEQVCAFYPRNKRENRAWLFIKKRTDSF